MGAVNNPDFPKEQIGKEYTLTVLIRGEKTQIPCKAEESLLWALERAGIKAPAHCRSGECGWCHSRLVILSQLCRDPAVGVRNAEEA